MRKVILYSILLLSINTYAQVKQPSLRNGLPLPASGEYLRKSHNPHVREMHNIALLPSQKNYSRQKQTKALSLIPIYDDVYMWTRDIPGKKWVYDTRAINLVYDVNSNLLSSVDQTWNGTGWVNDQQVTYTYTGNNLTDELWQKWNGTIWVNDYKYTTTYTADYLISLELGQLWNGSAWVNDYQSLYAYDVNKNRIKFTQQMWNGSSWDNSYQEASTYNTDKNVTVKLFQFWSGSDWTDGYRDNYSYDSGKKLIGILEESFTMDVWENYSKSSLTYDTNNNLTNELMQDWNGSGWDNYSNSIYAYDERNNLKTRTDQLWDGASWVQSSLNANTFDINNFMLSETNRNWTNSILINGDSTYYNIHTVITSINELNTETLSLFPNPGYGKFTIKSNNPIGNVEIYNMSGERVYSDTKNKQQNTLDIDLRNSSKGVYLLKVSVGNRIINRKVIIK